MSDVLSWLQNEAERQNTTNVVGDTIMHTRTPEML